MDVRFRYLAADGREVEVASTEQLVAEARSGRLTGDALLYDALSGGWAPARSHEAFLSLALLDLLDMAPEGPAADVVRGFDDLAGIALTLESEAAPPDTEELVAGLLRERAEDPLSPSFSPTLQADPARALEPTPILEIDLPAKTPPPAGDRPQGDEAPARVAAGPGEPPRWLRARSRTLRPTPTPAPQRRPTPGRPASQGPAARGDGRRAVQALGAAGATMATVAVVLVVAVVAGSVESGATGTAAQAVAGVPRPAERAPTPAGGLSAHLAATESEALRGLEAGLDSLRALHGVGTVPRAWLEGVYLAHASRYPDVRDFWERYGAYIEEVRANEQALFREGAVARLHAQGLDGPMVSMRLARALRIFEAERPGREGVYASMIELSRASVALHDLLVAREDEIVYEPALAGFSREPVLEAVALDPGLESEMDVLLDRILLAVEQVYGERATPREELADALTQGLRTAQK